MISKKKSSTLKTRKHKITNNKKITNNNISANTYDSKTINNININNNSIDYTNKYSMVTVNSNFTKKGNKRKKYKTFYSKVHTLRRMKRLLPKSEDKLIEFLDDNKREILKGIAFNNTNLDKYVFNNEKLNCICENIYKQHLENECKCNQMKTYSSQGKSGASIHSILCKVPLITNKKNKKDKTDINNEQQVLKVAPLSNYYLKLRKETEKYIFIEFDGFTIQTLINTYVYKELPNNTVNIYYSGVCSKKDYKNVKLNENKHGYNLMEEADLGSGRDFLNNIINGKYNSKLNITNEDKRYLMVCNCLLQIVLIIGHLQSSSLEFFHGDYKPENVFVKSCSITKTKTFKFNVFGKSIKVKNMGFAVLIADFDRSSMSLNSNTKNTNKKYRIISPILFKPLLTNYVNNIIDKYGDIDPDVFEGDIKLNKLFISNLIPSKMDPTITVLRSAGVKLFRDIDLYTFFIRLIETELLRSYIIKHKINTNIMSFMSENFRDVLFKLPVKNISLNESAYIVVKILNYLKEPLPVIFKHNYLDMLKNLNYKLFKM